MRKPKCISLTVRRDYRLDMMPIKKWEQFNYILHYWFQHREDGPAWISETEMIWSQKGREISRVNYPYSG